MLGRKPPVSWKGLVRSASSTAGYDVIVDPDPGDRAPLVVTAGPADVPAITHASPEGLARSLATRLANAVPVWTVPGKPRRAGRWYAFPSPVGSLRAEGGVATVEGDLGGAGAFGTTTLAVLDDARFLTAATMAAGALLAGTEAIAGPRPVWEMAEDYIAACEDLGLVIARAGD